MALLVSIGGFFTQQPGTVVTWTISLFNNQDRRVVTLAPNINDDLFAGPATLVVLNQIVVASDHGVVYQTTIQNPGPRAVRYNINSLDAL
ncbi:MAG TPA: hypothetical protein VF532_20940 [Candidatus Angelobacter sp.]